MSHLAVCLLDVSNFLLQASDTIPYEKEVQGRFWNDGHPDAQAFFCCGRPSLALLLFCHHRDGMLPRSQAHQLLRQHQVWSLTQSILSWLFYNQASL